MRFKIHSNKPKNIKIIPIFREFEIKKTEITPILESKIPIKVNM